MPNYVSHEAPPPGAMSVSSVTCDRPASVVEHDLLVAALYVGTSTLSPAPTDWTWLADPNPGNLHVRLAYKAASASESDSYTFEFSGSDALFGGIVAYRGTHYRDPVNASGYTMDSAASLSWSAPSVDTTTPRLPRYSRVRFLEQHGGLRHNRAGGEHGAVRARPADLHHLPRTVPLGRRATVRRTYGCRRAHVQQEH